MSKNYRAIIQFYKDNCKIEGLYCLAIQLTVEYNGEVKTLAMYSDEPEEQLVKFGDEILYAKFDDYTLYLERTAEIEVTELIVVPLHPAFDIKTTPHVEVKIEDNQIMLLTIAQNQTITKADIDSLCNRINTEAARRNASGSVGAVTVRSTLPSNNQQIAVGAQNLGGTYANIARPLNAVQTVSNPSQGGKIVATGAGSFGYLSSLVDTLKSMGPVGSSGCNSSCTGLCSTGCYSGCSGCSGTCSGGCTGSCGNNCTGGCSGSCGNSCQQGCSSACSGDCWSQCWNSTYGSSSFSPGCGDCC